MEHLGALHLAGLSRFYPFEKVSEIPDQWQSFAHLIPQVTGDTKPITYGAIYRSAIEHRLSYVSASIVPGEAFDPTTGAGGLEIWIPLAS